MKLLITSDSHGDTRALERCLTRNPDAAAVIFLGDGLRDLERLELDGPNPRGTRVYSVRGNSDPTTFVALEGFAPFGGLNIFYTHGHMYNVKHSLDGLARTAAARGADIALFGHTHKPALTRMNGVYLFNPGSISRAEGRGGYGILSIESGEPAFFHKSVWDD